MNNSQNNDKISKNLIYLLSLDARKPVIFYAKKLGVSRRVIEYRLEQLYAHNFIKPLLIYNHNSFYRFTIFLKLARFKENVLLKLKEIKQVKLKETIGEYDFSLLLLTHNKDELSNVLQKIDLLLHDDIITIDVIAHDFEDTLGYKSFCSIHSLMQDYSSLILPSRLLHKNELQIIHYLSKKPLASLKNIVSALKMSYSSVISLLNNLLDERIIRFSIDPYYDSLNLEFHNFLAKINPAAKEQFESYCKSHPHIHWMKRSTGRWDYVLSIATENVTEFIDVCREIRTSNAEIFFDAGVLISKIHKERPF